MVARALGRTERGEFSTPLHVGRYKGGCAWGWIHHPVWRHNSYYPASSPSPPSLRVCEATLPGKLSLLWDSVMHQQPTTAKKVVLRSHVLPRCCPNPLQTDRDPWKESYSQERQPDAIQARKDRYSARHYKVKSAWLVQCASQLNDVGFFNRQ